MVSIIIPTYSYARYIGEAIDSILSQTFKDFEIIVIDDGSTDGTGDIINKKYPMARYFFKNQGGVSSARNMGITVAKGAFIAFLDADDIWLSEKLEKQIDVFNKQTDVGMVFTEHSTFDKFNRTVDKSFGKREKLMKGDVVRNIFSNSYLTTSTVMVRKEVFDKVGLFEEHLRAAEDDNMWMRIAMDYQIELIDDPLVRYRISEGSLSRTFNNCIEGVKKNIELIRSRYPDLYIRLGQKSIRGKYFVIYFNEGYHCFTNKEYDAAKKHFIKSMSFNPYKVKTYIYYFSSFFSPVIIDKVKQLKRFINCKISQSW